MPEHLSTASLALSNKAASAERILGFENNILLFLDHLYYSPVDLLPALPGKPILQSDPQTLIATCNDLDSCKNDEPCG